MRHWITRAWAMGLAAGLAFAPSAGWADDGSNLAAEVAALKKRLQSLESRLAEQETRAAPAPAGGGGLPAIAQGMTLSGFVDASYQYNVNAPKNRTTSLRVFDTEANGFQPNALELVVEKPVSEESPVGFRADLDVGEDAEVVGSVTSGLGSTTDEIDLQQAYIEARLPLGNGLLAKFGKFVTLHGAEVIESKDNWNFSRSYLFGYAIPFTHTGVRFTYPWTSWLTTMFGVNNGWDVVDDNNAGKTVETSAALTLTPKTSLGVTYMVGPERNNDNRDNRNLVDVVLGYNPTDRLALKLNYDFGYEEDGVSEAKNAQWQGVAGYARYQWNDWLATALRSEYFMDRGGARTAQGRTVNYWELTATQEFKLYKDLITRLEYRHDRASEEVFNDHRGSSAMQDTIAAEVIYPF